MSCANTTLLIAPGVMVTPVMPVLHAYTTLVPFRKIAILNVPEVPDTVGLVTLTLIPTSKAVGISAARPLTIILLICEVQDKVPEIMLPLIVNAEQEGLFEIEKPEEAGMVIIK